MEQVQSSRDAAVRVRFNGSRSEPGTATLAYQPCTRERYLGEATSALLAYFPRRDER
jgi:hypothetical protein